jgi:hypothetical protein
LLFKERALIYEQDLDTSLFQERDGAATVPWVRIHAGDDDPLHPEREHGVYTSRRLPLTRAWL